MKFILRADAKIKLLTTPCSCRKIHYVAFSAVNALESLRISEGMEEFSDYLSDDRKLRSIWLPGSLRYISSPMFSNFCFPLKVHLPQGLELYLHPSISYKTAATLVVPSDVREINYNPAYKVLHLVRIIFMPNSHLERIGPYAFSFTKVETFDAPESLMEIGDSAFFECDKLASVNLSTKL